MKSIILIVLCLFSLLSTAQEYESLSVALDTSFYSEALGYEKPIQIITPASYSKGGDKSYPLIVVFDKQNEINYEYLLNTIDYLTVFGQIPECVVVGIEAGEGNGRYFETQLSANHDKAVGEENEVFIFDELIPHLKEFHQTGESVILFGHSRFGYYTSHLLSQRPNELLGVVSASPFFAQKTTNHVDLVAEALTRVEREHNLYYLLSVGDTVVDTDEYYDMMAQLERVQLADNIIVRGYEYPGADHIVVPGLTLNRALYDIFEEWNAAQMRFHRTTDSKIGAVHFEEQEQVLKAYGQNIPFGLGVYNGTGWRFYNDGNKKAAVGCWRQLVRHYPQFSYGYVFIAEALMDTGYDERSAEFLNSAKASLVGNTYLSQEEIEEVSAMITELENR